MRVFDETKTKELTEYDLDRGYLKADKIVKEHHEATPAVEAVSAEARAQALQAGGAEVERIGDKWYTVDAKFKNGGKTVTEIKPIEAEPEKEAWDEYEHIQVYIPYTQEQINARLSVQYIPSATKSAAAVGKMLLKTLDITDTEAKLEVSGLYDAWAPGEYAVGDIRNHAGQTYECHQAHDNAVYPDIKPDNPQTWATFWRPLHGKSKETARPWVKPWAGTTDMYRIGEYMVYTDKKTYRCVADTVYSPEEYASAWEEV